MGGVCKRTYENTFYTSINGATAEKWKRKLEQGKYTDTKNFIYGFPIQIGAWCNSKLKTDVLDKLAKGNLSGLVLSGQPKQETYIRVSDDKGAVVQFGAENGGNKKSTTFESEVVQYIGIAADEPERIERHKNKKGFRMPLVEIGWDEAYCRKWCEEHDLLSPIYTDSARGGCWFCHNQSVDQLRKLRQRYPDLWALLMKWDNDSPVTFRADGHTVHDYDRRFQAEDKGYIKATDRFKWADLECPQMNIEQWLGKEDTK